MRLLVTAGPTREFIDPVRFLSNRSTGRMGYAIAQAAVERGWETTLVSGPVSLDPPAGLARFVPVVSALDLLAAVEASVEGCDALVMCAAVADVRPRVCATEKLHKGTLPPALELVPNPDVLATLAPRKGDRFFVGFAAETDAVVASAADKLRRKGLDLIVANDVTAPGAGFAVETNVVTLLAPGCEPEPLPLMSKLDVAREILRRIPERSAR